MDMEMDMEMDMKMNMKAAMKMTRVSQQQKSRCLDGLWSLALICLVAVMSDKLPGWMG